MKLFKRPDDPRERRWWWIVRIAGVGTVAWFGGVLIVGLAFENSLFNLTLNEAGDFWAGVAAPPAFLWLILGFFQQKDELALQIEEMRHLLKENSEQTKLLRDENTQAGIARASSKYEQDFVQILVELFNLAKTLPSSLTRKPRSGRSAAQHSMGIYNPGELRALQGLSNHPESVSFLVRLLDKVPLGTGEPWLSYNEQFPEKYRGITLILHAKLEQLLELRDTATLAGVTRVEELFQHASIYELIEAIDRFVSRGRG